MQSYWSSQFPDFDTPMRYDETIDLLEDDTNPNANSYNDLYSEMIPNGFAEPNYTTKESPSKALSIVGPVFVSTYDTCDPNEIEAQSLEGICIRDPLALDDETPKSEVDLSILPQYHVCDTCGELYSSSAQHDCKPEEKKCPPSIEMLAQFNSCKNTLVSDGTKPQLLKKEHVEVTDSEQCLCPYCNEVFANDELATHIEKHSSMPYICDRCGNFFSSNEKLSVHEREHGDTVLCTNCFKVCDDAVDLAAHIATRALPLECGECMETFTSHCAMHSHRATCSPKKKKRKLNEKTIACSECDMIFRNKYSLEEHFRQHTGERPFCCKYCHISYSRKDNLNRHMRRNRISRENYKFMCAVCQVDFPSRCVLKEHCRTEHPENLTDLCLEVPLLDQTEIFEANGRTLRVRPSNETSANKDVEEEVNADSWKNSVLSSSYRLSCNSCSKTFQHKKSLKQHVELKHAKKNEELRYLCRICNYGFSEETQLDEHFNLHKDGTRFKCLDCETTFSTMRNLVRHLKRKDYHKKSRSQKKTGVDCLKKTMHSDEKVSTTETSRVLSVSETNSDLNTTSTSTKADISNSNRTSASVKKDNSVSNTASSLADEDELLGVENVNESTNGAHLSDEKIISMENFLTYQQLLMYVEETSKPYLCQVCAKSFVNKRNYLEHYMSHSKERPFKCDICSRAFIRERRLLDHKKEAHTRRSHNPRKTVHFSPQLESCMQSEYEKRSLRQKETVHSEIQKKPSTQLEIKHSKTAVDSEHGGGKNDDGANFHSSTYLSQFPHLVFKTPLISLNRFDLCSVNNDGSVQSTSQLMHYRCRSCCRMYSNKSALIAHQRNCPDKPVRTNEVAFTKGSTTSISKNLNKLEVYGMEHHISVENGKTIYICGVCGRHFDKRILIFKHSLIHVADKPYKCAICVSRGFMSRKTLRKHFKRSHVGMKINEDGTVTSLNDEQPAELANAWDDSLSSQLFMDQPSQGYFNDPSKSPENITVECDLNDLIGLFEPDVSMDKDREGNQISAAVNVTYPTSYPVQTVFLDQASAEKNYSQDVEMPYEEITPNYPLPLTVDHFLERDDIKNGGTPVIKSLNSYSSQIKTFRKCGQCNIVFKTIDDLVAHFSVHDLAGDSLKCIICNKEFSARMDLQMHALLHSRMKTFQCVYCGKTFRAKRDMDDHVRVHTGERPFECQICGRRFRVRKQLYSHRKIHVQPFKCSKCNSSFSLQWSLKRHEKTCSQHQMLNGKVGLGTDSKMPTSSANNETIVIEDENENDTIVIDDENVNNDTIVIDDNETEVVDTSKSLSTVKTLVPIKYVTDIENIQIL